MNSSDSTNKDFSDSKQNASNFQNKQLSNGCVLSVLIDSHAQAGITYFVGTDGDGVNWGTSDSRASFPEQWEVVDTSDTPAMQSDHVRFMELKNYDKEDAMLYVATYGGVSYARYNRNEPGFGPWKTATRLEFLHDNLNSLKDHIRSIHIARTQSHSLNKAKMYIATDQGLWVSTLNRKGQPSEWTNLGLGVVSISSVYATGNQDKDIILVGTTDHGLVIGLIEKNQIHWQNYDVSKGLASDHIWDVFITKKTVGGSIIIGTNGGGISWAQIEAIDDDQIQLSKWTTVNSETEGFPNNCNAQLFASGNKAGDTLWVGTRAGLAWAHFDADYNLSHWQTALIADTTNDIGSVLVQDGWITLGIYRTGLAVSQLDKQGNPTTWKVAQAKSNTDTDIDTDTNIHTE